MAQLRIGWVSSTNASGASAPSTFRIVGDHDLQSALAGMAWEMSKLEKTYVVLRCILLSPLRINQNVPPLACTNPLLVEPLLAYQSARLYQ
jgi:hypothetical protein